MDLRAIQVANSAVVELHLVTAVIRRFWRGCIGMLVVSEVGGHLHLLTRAIGRSRREGELDRQQQEEEKGNEAAHGGIMAEVLLMPRTATQSTARFVVK